MRYTKLPKNITGSQYVHIKYVFPPVVAYKVFITEINLPYDNKIYIRNTPIHVGVDPIEVGKTSEG